MRKASVNTIIKNIHKNFPTLDKNSEKFKTYVTMLASVQVGPNIKRVAKYTGYTRDFVATKAKKFRDIGIWNGTSVCGNWDSPSYGYIELKLDAAATENKCNRTEKWRKVLY